ncbi:hypothetical protein TPB0596_20610 [Tsukamurella pulmonis]|nr:hypothetical protein TPB0596_20610 [Tsukamurella pulmonis]
MNDAGSGGQQHLELLDDPDVEGSIESVEGVRRRSERSHRNHHATDVDTAEHRCKVVDITSHKMHQRPLNACRAT